MANRYWVDLVAGNWDAVTTTNWASSSGGTPGVSVPGSSDAVFFDANSGSSTVSLLYNPTLSTINFTGFTGTFTQGSNTITTTAWTAVSGMTYSGASGTININGNSSAFTTGSLTYGTVNIVSTANLTISGANATVGTLSISVSGGYFQVTCPSITVSTSLTIAGANNYSQRIIFGNLSYFVKSTITCNGSVSLTNVDFYGVTGAGSATWSGTSLGNAGNNSGVTFTTPKTVYWIQGASASQGIYTNANFATTSGGSASTDNFPLPQDTAVFDANSFGASGKTVTCTVSQGHLPTLDFTNVTNSPTISFNSNTYLTGNVTLAAGMTWSPIGNLIVIGLTSSSITSAGQTFCPSGTDSVDYASTITFNDNFANGSVLAFQIGTLNANNNNMSMSSFSNTGSSGRTLTMGSGTWTLTGTGAVWNNLAASNVTVTTTTSTLKLTDSSSSSKTVYGISKTWGNFWNNTGSTGVVIMGDGASWTNFKIDAGRTQQFTAGTTNNIKTMTATGSGGSKITIQSVTSATHTLNLTSTNLANRFVSCDYLLLDHSIATPTGNWFAGANSTDNGNNSGWSFTAAPTENISNVMGITLANAATINRISAININKFNNII